MSARLLPHGGYARFVDEVVASSDNALECRGRIPVENSFVREGVAPGFVLLEFAAQAAAIEVLARVGDKEPRSRIGYLTRARGLDWTPEGVPAGAPLTARVRRVDSIPPLYIYRATITLEGSEVFGGEFSIYVDQQAD